MESFGGFAFKLDVKLAAHPGNETLVVHEVASIPTWMVTLITKGTYRSQRVTTGRRQWRGQLGDDNGEKSPTWRSGLAQTRYLQVKRGLSCSMSASASADNRTQGSAIAVSRLSLVAATTGRISRQHSHSWGKTTIKGGVILLPGCSFSSLATIVADHDRDLAFGRPALDCKPRAQCQVRFRCSSTCRSDFTPFSHDVFRLCSSLVYGQSRF